MDTTIAALVAASAAAAAIYVFHRNSNTPTPAGKVSSGVYIYDTLQPAVVTAVQQTGYFALYDLAQLAGGKLFVVDEPKGEEEGELPKLPGGRPLRPKPPTPIQIDGTKCILLDIREYYKLFARSLLAELKAEEEADKASVATPKEYEETGRQHIVSLLESNFGLRIVLNALLHRLDKEIPTAVLKGAIFDSEWDFRAPVLCSGPGPQTPGKTDDFIIYPDREAYIRPARPARGKVLTPTKIGATEAPQFIAIFEITTEADWTGNLLPRLEQRLAVSLDRARSLDDSVSGLLDVVAVIGVLGIAPWQRRMTSRVTAAKTPLLYEMMQASRFVFLYREYAGSPHRSIAGRSGGKGGAGLLSPLAAAGGGGTE